MSDYIRLSILKLSDKYTALRLENAYKLALEHILNPTYKNIRLILEAGQDEKEAGSPLAEQSDDHALIRGSSYYLKTKTVLSGCIQAMSVM